MSIPAAVSPQTPEALAFWASFWPSFWSGTASGITTGLVTGLVVGIILLRYQRGVEERATIKAYDAALSVKLDGLRRALSSRDVLNITSAVSAAPTAASQALSILQALPITVWKDALPKRTKLLQLALDLQRFYAAFNALASETDELLIQLVRSFNHGRGADSANDALYRQMSIGFIFGRPIAELLPWLASHGPGNPEPYEHAWTQISQNARLAELQQLLPTARSLLETTAQELLVAIEN